MGKFSQLSDIRRTEQDRRQDLSHLFPRERQKGEGERKNV
jgi:ubiquitin